MKHILTILSALVVTATFATAEDKPAAPAAEKPKHNPEEMFKKKDSNSDGSVSKEEFLAGAKDAAKAEEAFKHKDKDSDGKLSKEEFSAHGGKKK